MLQEHHLYKEQFDLLARLSYGVTAKSAMDIHKVREGRPFGGCAILWRPSLHVKVVECDSDRLCAILVNIMENINVLILCAYMPCDRRWRDSNYDECLEVLSEAERLVYTQDPEYLIIGGDLNTDMTRTSPQTQLLHEFIQDSNLTVGINMPQADVPYTFISSSGETSRIDHFLLSTE